MVLMRYVTIVLMIGVVCTVVGCKPSGPNVAPVKGVVTVDGAPGKGLKVEFLPEGEGRGSGARTNDDGEYELMYSIQTEGALIGKHMVVITTQNPHKYGPPPPDFAETLPDRYHSKSELTAEVKKGRNKINFDLTTD